MKQAKINQKEILNALSVHKQLPGIPMTKLDQQKAKTLLSKHLTMAEVFDVIEIITYPYNKQVASIDKRLSLTGMVLDKLAKHERVRKSTLDKMWSEAEDELDKANKEQLAKMKAELNKAVKGQIKGKQDDKKDDK